MVMVSVERGKSLRGVPSRSQSVLTVLLCSKHIITSDKWCSSNSHSETQGVRNMSEMFSMAHHRSKYVYGLWNNDKREKTKRRFSANKVLTPGTAHFRIKTGPLGNRLRELIVTVLSQYMNKKKRKEPSIRNYEYISFKRRNSTRHDVYKNFSRKYRLIA